MRSEFTTPAEPYLRRLGTHPAVATVRFFVLLFAAFVGLSVAFRGSAELGPLVLPLFGLGIAARGLYRYARSLQWRRLNGEGAQLLNARRLPEAAARFTAAARAAQSHRHLALSGYNLALTALAQGDVARALCLAGTVETSRGLSGASTWNRALPYFLSVCYSARGELEAANRWLETGRVRRGSGPAPLYCLLAECLVLCREGQTASVVQELKQRWGEAESSGRFALRLSQLVRAFALEQLGKPERELSAALAALRPVERGELDYLGLHWPALGDFLRRRGLSAGA